MADPRIKEMRIKTGIVKRCGKEIGMYQKEAQQIKDKIKKMQEEGQEVYYIKKQDGLLQETLSVIPDCQKRFNNAYTELQALLEAGSELEEDEIYQTAKAQIEESASLASV